MVSKPHRATITDAYCVATPWIIAQCKKSNACKTMRERSCLPDGSDHRRTLGD
jgi:hypothetical protein